jgi:hypothetical protein
LFKTSMFWTLGGRGLVVVGGLGHSYGFCEGEEVPVRVVYCGLVGILVLGKFGGISSGMEVVRSAETIFGEVFWGVRRYQSIWREGVKRG